MEKISFVAFYRFMKLPHFRDLQKPLQSFCEALDVKGSILLASEGINSTISGTRENLEKVLAHLNTILPLPLENAKFSEAVRPLLPFKKMKVKLKKEIVTIGDPSVDPNTAVGIYVKPKEWNALVSDPDVLVLDTRNSYEVAIGTFENAVDPQCESFREFPEKSLQILRESGKKRVAMFCTGGIRCEKASSFLVSQGIETYHLAGGILKYLEEVPQDASLWRGDCFVFDERVSVDHSLQPGDYKLCRGCRDPISEDDRRSPLFEEGVSCPGCYHKTSEDDKARFRDRQKHFEKLRSM